METTSPNHRTGWLMAAVAWLVMLLVSDLPNILLNLSQGEPDWLFLTKAGVLVVFLCVTLFVPKLRLLWQVAVIFLAFLLIRRASAWLGGTALWQNWFGQGGNRFYRGHLGWQLLGLLEMTAMIAVTLAVRRQPSAFFLAKGQLDAPLQPVRWLGIRSGERWSTFGWIFGGCIAAGIAIFVAASSWSAFSNFGKAAALYPGVILCAAMNALSEELTFRSPLLSTTHEVIGQGQALAFSSVFFGLAHFLYGDPSGVIGFLFTAFVAFLFGKSMLETRGSLWAWFMHFVADIPIFLLYALTSV